MPGTTGAEPVILAEPKAPTPPPAPSVPQVPRSGDDATAGWDGVLEPGETAVWSGAPAPAGRGGRFVSDMLAPAFFVVIGLAVANSGGSAALIGVGFAALAVWLTVLRKRGRARVTATVRYLLTDRRAVIATPTAGAPRIESFPITAQTRIRLAGNGVFFDERRITDRDRGVKVMPAGFTGLADAGAVHDLFLQIQRSMR
ncbi:MAG: hypothetical protein AB7U46_09255 [Paenirhodobacter sp.]